MLLAPEASHLLTFDIEIIISGHIFVMFKTECMVKKLVKPQENINQFNPNICERGIADGEMNKNQALGIPISGQQSLANMLKARGS